MRAMPVFTMLAMLALGIPWTRAAAMRAAAVMRARVILDAWVKRIAVLRNCSNVSRPRQPH
jgi:hypothetical protein